MNNRSGLIRRISYDEIPFQAQASFRARSLRIPEETLRRAWLGSFERELGAISTKYTIGDAFCGAGGVSRGAALAGLAVSWGFDVDAIVGMSYLSNFPQATFHQVDAQHFHTTPDVHVDVLHLSPSCQAFSAMNTTEDGGQHGEYNRDSFLSCLAVVKHVRPRIVTMEQVPGILFARSSAYFNNFVRDLVDIGFSVRWDVLACEHFGVPQTRKRLFLIASCPGHSLPSLPTATGHASKVNDYLHRSAQRTEFADRWHETITTKGGLALDGSRLTIAELQAIQAFPYNHIFQGTDAQIRRQIGNAVPPQLARCIFMQVLDCLREVDRGDTILIE
ncbi:protein of unknown function [Taphrina deformans PYCC 5710]|uniref:DNA (cytosine-5-)-methyltransferase n=1 Tax=Taphrina deformans (strain PYCC 5710 / ATCC 11124 / CBS 356.35 / IMI 108563 / JCM 9778 / NBRC 8474) TaxID=1097556 RepID=R4XEZ4_TAPDE|nr:protein of unknown function [Taphrina deformans PYCC 5710]|eukprot:CCG84203.1 protein of unknown function [Taphrina deformans PYCC 5710]